MSSGEWAALQGLELGGKGSWQVGTRAPHDQRLFFGPSVLCCFAFSLSQDWELPARREVCDLAGPWHWICQEGCGAMWAEEVTCVVAGWFLPVTGAVLCTGGEAATEGGCSGHAGEAPSFQLGHRWMTHLLAAPRSTHHRLPGKLLPSIEGRALASLRPPSSS